MCCGFRYSLQLQLSGSEEDISNLHMFSVHPLYWLTEVGTFWSSFKNNYLCVLTKQIGFYLRLGFQDLFQISEATTLIIFYFIAHFIPLSTSE